MRPAAVAIVAVLTTVALSPAAADGPVGFRMDGDGRYPGTSPAVSWSESDSVIWKTEMPSTSNASPVLLDGGALIVVLSDPDQVVGVSGRDGSILWRDSLASVVGKRPAAHEANGWTTPTPVSDGDGIYSVFGSGVVAAHSTDGERRWARLVEQPKHRWGHSASPVLAGGRLIVHLVDLVGLDPATGDEVWRATADARWGSLVVATIAGTEVVITPSGDVFRATDGRPVASGIGNLKYATPVVQDGVVYFIEKRATAVRLPEAIESPFETIWESRIQGSRHYASPVVHAGRVYAVSREERFSVLDATTGALLHERQLDLGRGSNSAYPSLAVAGDKVFVSAENGATVVLEADADAREVARGTLDGFRSSPVFAGDRMYVRTFGNLWCIGDGG